MVVPPEAACGLAAAEAPCDGVAASARKHVPRRKRLAIALRGRKGNFIQLPLSNFVVVLADSRTTCTPIGNLLGWLWEGRNNGSGNLSATKPDFHFLVQDKGG
jgi:hypothetical protein